MDRLTMDTDYRVDPGTPFVYRDHRESMLV